MKKLSLLVAQAVLALSLMVACTAEPVPTEPSFDNSWIRSLPGGMQMTAGFGTLNNLTTETIEIEGFSSTAFRDVSLHRTEVIDGVSSMSEVREYTLAPGERLEMAPGGYHLMLMGPLTNMTADQIVTLDLHTADGRVFHFEVPVEKR